MAKPDCFLAYLSIVVWNGFYLVTDLVSRSKINLTQSTYRIETSSEESGHFFNAEDGVLAVFWCTYTGNCFNSTHYSVTAYHVVEEAFSNGGTLSQYEDIPVED